MKNLILLLSQIKNASTAYKNTLLISNTKSNLELLNLLYKEGLIQKFINFYPTNKKTKKFIVHLRYYYNRSAFINLKILSKPTLPLILNFNEVCSIYDKRHILFLSTNQGLLTSLTCKKLGIGGIALFRC